MGRVRDPRRQFLAIAGVLILLGVLACSASSASPTALILPSCACGTYPPTHPPGWTPSPSPVLSIRQAEGIATRLVGEPMSSYGGWDEFGGQPVLVTHSPDAYAYVQGNTGAVLTAFFANDLPVDAQTGVSADGALSAATEWLAGVGTPATGATPAVEARTAGGLPYFQATWTAGSSPAFEVLVNAASGHVFAYRELGGVWPDVPLIGFAAASAMAERSPLAHGEPASPGDMNNLMWDGDHWLWTVGFNDGALSVDAATGEVATMKWSESR